ncbi:tRNA-binding protein [Bacillus coahuilensis m2-6]|uniref:YtpR family tRNA-binding protein n=1 Tax=Bacillus coahuilensis TaxID=408580 RepID=UPI00018511A1|nr:DUF4479 family protein [Bacillus coahuilensis]KUP06711.1 tRNA-binding protein [Bacillus coahuilensis m2-6]
MNVFYNKEGIGDTLIVSVKDAPKDVIQLEKKNDVARIFDASTNETVGYNVFHASKYMTVVENGPIKMDDNRLKEINAVLFQNGFEEALEADFSPKFVVGYVESKEKHPDADKLNVCSVNVGDKTLQIVCGAPNVDAGQKVVVAKVGAVMPSGMVIKDAELRGVASSGMICSAKELDLPNAPKEKGILVLEDTYTVGDSFF